jgi:hypothetical protein
MRPSASSSSRVSVKVGEDSENIRLRLCPNFTWRKLQIAMTKLRKMSADTRNCFVKKNVNYVPFICPECGNDDQEHFIEDQNEGDVICHGKDGEGCGLVMVERAINHSPEPEYEDKTTRCQHGFANTKHLSEASHLSASLLRNNSQKKAFRIIKKIHMEVAGRYSQFGRDNRQTRLEFKEQQIQAAASVFREACTALGLHDRVANIALDYFAAYRMLVEQIKDLAKWHAACLVLALPEANQLDSQARKQVAIKLAPPIESRSQCIPPTSQIMIAYKLAPPVESRHEWIPPPPPSKKRKKSCLFHASPKQVQKGDCMVQKECSAKKMRTDEYLRILKRTQPVKVEKVSDFLDAVMEDDFIDEWVFKKDVVSVASPMIGSLMSHEFGFVFGEPVDPVKLDLPDYFDLIKRPMDLGTVQSKLHEFCYESLGLFAEDVRLTFHNCMRYNDPGSELFVLASDMLQLFETMLAEVATKE